MYKVVVEILEGWVGGILVVKNWKFRRGGGAYVKFPPWWGYGYFLELHDRNYKFRSCYDSFKTKKEEFEGIPIMVLTATLDDSQLVDLRNNYLRCPVVIKGNVNKKNTKLNVENYQNMLKRM